MSQKINSGFQGKLPNCLPVLISAGIRKTASSSPYSFPPGSVVHVKTRFKPATGSQTHAKRTGDHGVEVSQPRFESASVSDILRPDAEITVLLHWIRFDVPVRIQLHSCQVDHSLQQLAPGNQFFAGWLGHAPQTNGVVL